VTALLLPMLFLYFKFCSGTSSTQHDKKTKLFDWYDTFQGHSILPMPQLLKISMFLGVFYACADYLWYCALAQVSVTVASTIFNCSPLFVYIFSVCLLNESVTPLKIFGVLTSLFGVTLIVFFQNNNSIDLVTAKHVNSANILSGIMVVVSAALYAAYEVLLKFLIGKDTSDRSTVMILTGFTGLSTVPVWLVGAFFLHLIKWPALHESIALPETLEAIGYLCSSGLMALVFNVFLPLSISLTSPLETSVGCMLTIPLSGLLDKWWHNAKFSIECIIGSFLVMVGFGLLEVIATRFAKEEDELEQHQYKQVGCVIRKENKNTNRSTTV
jgi:solute carrier family 35 protein F5